MSQPNKLVSDEGFELSTSCSQSRHSNQTELIREFWSGRRVSNPAKQSMLNIYMKTSNCQYCEISFNVIAGSFGKFCSLSCGTAFRNKASAEKAESNYNLNSTKCKHCQSILEYQKRKNKYCSRSCAAKVSNQVIRKRGPSATDKPPFSTIKFVLCKHTGQYYSNRNTDGSFRKCSPYIKTDKEKYYSDARFKFNVYLFPEEFDLTLIEQHGWYTCPGKKRKGQTKNTTGVSRDHIVSVSYGFANNIDPKIISHPANCRLMLHSENKNKSSKCNLTIHQLLLKIEDWNRKYTERRIGIEPTTSCLEGKYSTN